jgi:hypothetical protein
LKRRWQGISTTVLQLLNLQIKSMKEECLFGSILTLQSS